MTSSETPTEPPGVSPAAQRRAVLAVAIVVGWVFIFWANRWHLTAPVVFLGIGWVAVVATVHNLWRTGNVPIEDSAEDATWWKPVGAREELEREKRLLLKVIKDVEFDRQTGKMSDTDAAAMTQVYRARAIEVIKAIDELDEGAEGSSVREEIERELRARLALENKTEKKKKGKGKGKGTSGLGPRASGPDREAEVPDGVPEKVAEATADSDQAEARGPRSEAPSSSEAS